MSAIIKVRVAQVASCSRLVLHLLLAVLLPQGLQQVRADDGKMRFSLL